MNRWSWLIAALASLLVFVWLTVSDNPQQIDLADPFGGDDPDLHMTGGMITQYDEAGAVRYHLSFSEIDYFDSKALTHLQQPTLTLDRTPHLPWQANANEGWVSQRTNSNGDHEEVVRLRDDVRLANTDPNEWLELTAPEMYIYPDRRFAETHQPVMISSNFGHTIAAGLSGDLNTDLLKLSSSPNQRVKTVVLPGQDNRVRRQPPQSGG